MSSEHDRNIQKQLDGLLDGFSSFHESEKSADAKDIGDEAFRTLAESSPLVSVLLERASVMEDSEHASEMICEAAKIHLDGQNGEEASFAVLVDGLEKFPGNLRIIDMIFSWGQRHKRLADVKSLLEQSSSSEGAQGAGDDPVKLRLVAIKCLLKDTLGALADLGQSGKVEEDDNADLYLDLIEDQSFTEENVLVFADFFARVNEQDRALRLLNKAVVVSSDSLKKSNLYYKIGLLESLLGRTRTAEWNFEQALMCDATCEKSLRQIRKCLRNQDKTHELCRLLTKIHALNTHSEKRAELAYEIALLHEELKNDEDAISCFKRVLDDSPDHAYANYALAMNLYKEGRVAESESYFDSVLRTVPSSQMDPLEIYSKAAICYSKNKNFDKAVVAYEMAVEISPQNTSALVGLAGALLSNQEFDRAYEVASTVFMLDTECSAEFVAELFGIMGHCQSHSGNPDQAEAYFRRSLEAAYTCDGWRSLDRLLENQGKFKQRVALLMDVNALLDESTLVKSLGRLSDAGINGGQHSKALAGFYALVCKRYPNNRSLLQSAIDYFSFAKHWPDAVSAIVRIAHMETRHYEKAKYFHAAFSFESRYGDLSKSVEYGKLAIESYFAVAKQDKSDDSKKTAIDLFYKMNDLFFRLNDFKSIEKNYRMILKKFGRKDAIAAELWKEIGIIYRDHLGENKLAIHALEVAAELGIDCEKNLLDLYKESGTDHSEKAMQKRLKMLSLEPFESEHYKALRKIYVERREMDKVWCVTQALSLLGKADENEALFYEKFKCVDRRPQDRLTDGDWDSFAMQSEDRRIGAILKVVCETVALMYAKDAESFDTTSDATSSFEILRGMSDVLQSSMDCPGFEVCIQPQKQAGLAVLNAKSKGALTPKISCGRWTYEGRKSPAIVFDLARFLTTTRRENYLSTVLKDDDELSAVFCAALSLVYPETTAPKHLHKAIGNYKKLFSNHLTLPLRQDLTRAVVDYISRGGKSSMKTWRMNINKSSLRVGLLYSGDLMSVSAYLAIKNKDKIRSDQAKELGELLIYSVSESYFRLRKKLGLAIDSFEPKAPTKTISRG